MRLSATWPGHYLTGLWLCLALSIPTTTQAIVNIESQRDGRAEKGLGGRLELGLSGDSGNSDRNEWRLGGRLQWQESPANNLLFITHLNYGESRGIRNSNRAFAHLRLTHKLTQKRAFETFAQLESDEFARLNLRALIGAGLRLTHQYGNYRQALGTGLFRAWEKIQDTALEQATDEPFWRGNFYWHLETNTAKQLTLSSTLYLQPRLGPFADVRIFEQLACDIPLTNSLRLRLSLDLIHDSRPPTGVEQTDLHYRTDFNYNF